MLTSTVTRRSLRATLGGLLVAAAVTGAVATTTAAHADGRKVAVASGTDVGARLQDTAKGRDVPVLATATAAPAATTATAVDGVPLSAFDARLVADVNAARTAAGLHALRVTTGTVDLARGWSGQLALAGTLSHNGSYVAQLDTFGSRDWTTCAENVGYGPADNADTLFAAYMNSPHHKDNILSTTAAFVGIATRVDAAGRAWNTMDFVNDYSDSYGAPRTSV